MVRNPSFLSIDPVNSVLLAPKRGVIMNAKRKIEVFSVGCPACEETIELVNRVLKPKKAGRKSKKQEN